VRGDRNFTLFEINRDVDFETEIEAGLLVVNRVYNIVLVSNNMRVLIDKDHWKHSRIQSLHESKTILSLIKMLTLDYFSTDTLIGGYNSLNGIITVFNI